MGGGKCPPAPQAPPLLAKTKGTLEGSHFCWVLLPDQSLLIETVKNMHHSLSSNMDTSLIRLLDGAFYRSMRGLLVVV